MPAFYAKMDFWQRFLDRQRCITAPTGPHIMIALVLLVIFLAAFQQSMSGFGFALLAMPILVQMLGISVAAPLIAGLGWLLTVINTLRWRRSLDFGEIRRLGLWMLLGIPAGILSVDYLNETLLKTGLGVLLVGYALFALFKPDKLPVISRRWAYPAGLVAGLLGGAYNTPGPPLILYGNLRQWPHERFRAVLQSLFAFSATMVAAGHLLARHYTPKVLNWLWPAALAVLAGVVLGSWLDRHLHPQQIRTWITVVTLLLGVSLFF